jgi:hypothetical protein
MPAGGRGRLAQLEAQQDTATLPGGPDCVRVDGKSLTFRGAYEAGRTYQYKSTRGASALRRS